MKLFTRILCILLVVVTLLPLMVACKKGEETPGGNNPGGVNDPSNGTVEDLNRYQMERQDFGGRTIRFLGWTAAATNEFEVDQEDSKKSTLLSALYTRNEMVKELLNVDLKWTYTRGHALFEHEYVAEADRLLLSQAIDVCTPYSRVASLLMVQGLIQDVSRSESIDLTQPWWSKGLLENGALYGRVYFIGGDISWSFMSETIAMYFNKKMLSANAEILNPYGVTSMYDMVREKKWTLETMIQMSKAVAADAVGGVSNTETYGYSAHIGAMDAFYKASGLDWMNLDNNGALKVSDDQYGSKVDALVKTLTEFYQTRSANVTMEYYADWFEFANPVNKANPKCPAWQAGRSLFMMAPIVSITDYHYAELGFAFGVLPVPMYDLNQGEYKTTPGFEYSLCCVPRNVTGFEEVCYVLECMAVEGYYTTAPAYYTQTLRKQISDSADDYAMWETIRGAIEMDTGRLFEIGQGAPWAPFRNALIGGKTTYAETFQVGQLKFETDVEDMNKEIRKLEKKFGT